MNSIEQQTNQRTNEIKRLLVTNPEAYVESIAKDDAHNLVDIIDVSGSEGTALRLVMGATAEMPFRALSYVDSLLRVARMIPAAQVQIVHANHLGSKVNGLDLVTSKEQALLLARKVEEHLKQFPDLEGRVLHAVDTPMHTDCYTDVVRAVFDRDVEIATTLYSKGSKHGGDSIRYVAAHFAFQDTDDLVLEGLLSDAPNQTAVNRIVSVGCIQERTFYKARMGMRAMLQPSVATAQVYTRHVSPPYYIARGGEPALCDDIDPDSVGDVAAQRDIRHFININNLQGEQK